MPRSRTWMASCSRSASSRAMIGESAFRGHAKRTHAAWAIVLDTAYRRHPERFARKPTPPQLPTAGWMNKADTKQVAH